MLKLEISETFSRWSLPSKCREIQRITCPWIKSPNVPCNTGYDSGVQLNRSFHVLCEQNELLIPLSRCQSIKQTHTRGVHEDTYVPSEPSCLVFAVTNIAGSDSSQKVPKYLAWLKGSLNYRYKNIQKHYMVYLIVLPTLRRFLNSSAINLFRKARSSPEPPSLSSSSS